MGDKNGMSCRTSQTHDDETQNIAGHCLGPCSPGVTDARPATALTLSFGLHPGRLCSFRLTGLTCIANWA